MPKSTAKSTTDEDLELLAELGVDINPRNYRLPIIYDNGTESDLLLRSGSDRRGNPPATGEGIAPAELKS